MRPIVMVLGIFGGVFGLIAAGTGAWVEMAVYRLPDDSPGTNLVVAMTFFGVFAASIMGIIGAAMSLTMPRFSAALMVASSLVGLLAVGSQFGLAAVLLFAATAILLFTDIKAIQGNRGP